MMWLLLDSWYTLTVSLLFFQYLLYVRLFDLRKPPPHPATFYEVFQTFYQVASVYIQDFFYATILIEHGDPIFGCVSEFLAEKTSQLPSMRVAVARAQWGNDDDDGDEDNNAQRPRVSLGPRELTIPN